MKKKLISLVQLLIGLGILAFIFHRLHSTGQLGKMREAALAAGSHWPLLLGALACFGVCLMICACRWKILLDAQDAALTFPNILSLTFIGQFFNMFIVGATGGDVVKAYYVAVESRVRKAEAVATVFIDRLIGLLAIVVLAAVIMLARWDFFMATRETRLALIFVGAVVLASAVGLLLVFSQNLFDRIPAFKRLEERTSLGRSLSRVYTAFQTCLKSRALLVQTLLLSLANHVMLILGCFALGRAIGLPLGFGAYLTVFPVINMFAAIPITPSGIGTREAAALFMMGQYGVAQAQAATLSLMLYGTMMLWSLFGGLVYLAYSLKKGAARRAEMSDA